VITINRLTKAFADHSAVDDVSLSVPSGAFLVLLGPSGCGKSTMLRMLAGLENPTGGQIHFGETLAADGATGFSLPPARRDAGLVFQSYALWPHMTVAGNIEWPLKVAGLSRDERRARVSEALEMLAITALANRFPGEISGGQQQRVALARMIAPRPKFMLFDEPLSNLDATLRVEMRFELLRVHRATGTTTVYVTHDQVEAMTMASHVAVMNHGRVEQFATPDALLASPSSAFVARFVGTPPANLLPIRDGAWFAEMPDAALKGQTGFAMVRPEELFISETKGPRTIEADLVEIVPMAGRRLVTGLRDGLRITAISDTTAPLPQQLHFQLPAAPSALFDTQGKLIA
jgi:iron(III) transport system ATP-binding protein